MDFFTVSRTKRPMRLCEGTRAYAYRSLEERAYGREARANDCVCLDDIADLENMSDIARYDAAIRAIAERAPLRLCEGELLTGAATLGMAIDHLVPVKYHGSGVFQSISHLTIDFPKVLRRGVDGIRQDVLASLEKHTGGREREFLVSCLNTIDSMRIWRDRYIAAMEGKEEYAGNLARLRRVPFAPAGDFREAVESLWFTFAFVRLTGNWPGIGRIDQMLAPYYAKDVREGRLTRDEAREVLAHFFIKGCEWNTGEATVSGDAQHYQNLVLAGVDEDGNEVANDVTCLILDVIEELGISDYPTTIRVGRNTDDALIRRACEVVRFGGGIIAFYNEDTVLSAMTRYGYPEREARRFANDGCWEVQVPGKTWFGYRPFDSLAILEHDTLGGYEKELPYGDFEALYRAYVKDLGNMTERIFRERTASIEDMSVPVSDMRWKRERPCTVVSLFEEGCIEKGLSYLEGGSVYQVFSPHIGGLPDTVNSLYAIKKLVYDEKKLTLNEFCGILAADFEGHEELRRHLLELRYYGNDNDECDGIAARLLHDFALLCKKLDGRSPYRFPAGVSTFGRQLEWAPNRLASPHGHKKGEVLAPNCSPTPGSDREGATAIIKSYCKSDLTETVTGAALDIRLLPSNTEGEDGLNALVMLVKGFVLLGGFFMQPDIQDRSILLDAQAHPDNYRTLSVRVSGWNARFVTLSREWQDMVINENK